MARHWILLVVVSALGTVYDQRATARAQRDGSNSDERNVILVVSDGLRWQEVFRGVDSTILFGDSRALGDQAEATRRKYWRPTVAQRREALMPFLWSTLAREGQLLGNRDLDSRVEVTNEMKFSYPGYNEMLTGRPDPRIDNNDFGPNPNVTVFERLNRWGDFRGRVAAFGTWDTFRDIFNVNRSGIDVQTFGAKPNDVVVQRAVLSYLGDKRPRALFVATPKRRLGTRGALRPVPGRGTRRGSIPRPSCGPPSSRIHSIGGRRRSSSPRTTVAAAQRQTGRVTGRTCPVPRRHSS
jgi:hypothetical protein